MKNPNWNIFSFLLTENLHCLNSGPKCWHHNFGIKPCFTCLTNFLWQTLADRHILIVYVPTNADSCISPQCYFCFNSLTEKCSILIAGFQREHHLPPISFILRIISWKTKNVQKPNVVYFYILWLMLETIILISSKILLCFRRTLIYLIENIL